MARITDEQQLVRNLSLDAGTVPGPEPGHEVVVFEDEGGGRRLRAVLREEQRFARRWQERLGRKPNFQCYVVPVGGSLHYSFSRIFSAWGGQGDLTVAFDLSYRVQDSVELVRQLDRDPLRQVVDSIVASTRNTLNGLVWSQLEGLGADAVDRDLEQKILDDLSDSRDGGGTHDLSRLQDEADPYGIRVLALQLGFVFPREVVEVWERKDGLRRRESLKDLEAEARIAEAEREERVANDTHGHKLSEARRGDDLMRIGEARKFFVTVCDKATDVVANTLEHVAQDTESISQLGVAIRELYEVRQQVAGLLAAQPSSQVAPSTLVSSTPLALTSPSPSGVGRWLRSVQRVGEDIPDDELRESFLAASLHSLADACRSNETADESRWTEEFEEVFRQLTARDLITQPEDLQYLGELREIGELRRSLAESRS